MISIASFHRIVCDNCTITLLESSNDLSYYIQSETQQIDLNSVPAPWSRLLSYENASEHLILKLEDIVESTEKIENYNDLQVDKVNYAWEQVQITTKSTFIVIDFSHHYCRRRLF